jgi:hypothetical protein
VLVSDNMKPSAQCAKAVKTPGAVWRHCFTFIWLYKRYVLLHLGFTGQS